MLLRSHIALVSLALCCASYSLAESWTGGSASASWSEGGNWDTGMVPPTGSNVVFGDAFNSGQNISLDGDRSVGNLTIATVEPISLGGGTLMVNGNITRQDLAGDEATQIIDADVLLASGQRLFTIDGSNALVLAGDVGKTGSAFLYLEKAGTGTLSLDGNTVSGLQEFTISAGKVVMDSANVSAFARVLIASGATIEGSGVLEGIVDIDGTVVLAGDMMLGKSTSFAGVRIDGALAVGPHTATLRDSELADLRGSMTLAGGTVNSLSGIFLATTSELTGFGTINAGFRSALGGRITATDDLTFKVDVGLTGFEFGGTLDVGNNLVAIIDSFTADLFGETLMGGGTLRAQGGLVLQSAHTLRGAGTIDASVVVNFGRIEGGPGTLRFTGLLRGDGLGVTGDVIVFGPTGGYIGDGTLAAKIQGQAGSTITANNNLTLGDASSSAGIVHAGLLDVAKWTVTLHDADYADLGNSLRIDGGVLVAQNGIRMPAGAEIRGDGTIQGSIVMGPNSNIVAGNTAFDDLTLGDPASPLGLETQGDVNVGLRTVTAHDSDGAVIGGQVTLAGGELISPSGVTVHDVSGHGEILGSVFAPAGSTITATGHMTLGDAASSNGFRSDGAIAVGTYQITLLDSDHAELSGETTLSNGILRADKGVDLKAGATIAGVGVVDADVLNSGRIIGGSGTLQIAGNVTSIGQGISGDTIALSFTGAGDIEAKVLAGNIVATGDLAFGNEAASDGATVSNLVVGPHTVTIRNAGVTHIRSLTLRGGTVVAENGIALAVEGSGSLMGYGTIDGDLTHSGTNNPDGTYGQLHITGDYTQLADASLTFVIAGASPGTEHDQLTVDGHAQLDGRLNAHTLGGFTPGLGDRFVLITAGEISGTFDEALFPVVSTGQMWQLQYSPAVVALLLTVPGDYNADGTVNAADYVVWRELRGRTGTGLPADGNRDGQVNPTDYNIWRANFGKTAASPAGEAATLTPEPATLLLLFLALATIQAHHPRRGAV